MNDCFTHWMINAGVQLALLVTVIAAIAWIGRGLSARLRYALWLLVLVKALLPPFIAVPWSVTNQAIAPLWQAFSHNQATINVAQHAVPVSVPFAEPQDALIAVQEITVGNVSDRLLDHNPSLTLRAAVLVPDDGHAMNTSPETPLFPWLFTLWLGGVVIYWSFVLSCYRWAICLLAKGNTLRDGPIHALAMRLAKQLGIRKTPQIVLSDAVRSPFLWGWTSPRIAIPADFPGETGTDEMESVLLHELMHWKRGDLIVARLELLVRSLFWFHPFVWYALHELRKARESACDETLLATGCIAAKRYGDSLLNVMHAIREPNAVPVGFLGFLGILERKTQLQQRLEEIMSQQHHVKRIGLFGWGFLIFLTLCVLPMAMAQKETPKAEEKPAEMQVETPTKTESDESDYKSPYGFTHLITFEPQGDFAPRTPRNILAVLNKPLFEVGIRTGYFRTKPVDGKLIGTICTDKPQELKELIEKIPQLKYIKTERLTKEMFEEYEKTQQLSLQPSDGGFVSPHAFTHIVYVGGKGDFVPKSDTSLSRAVSEAFKGTGLAYGVTRARVEDGKQLSLILTDEPDAFKQVLDALPNLQYIRSERLTDQAMYDEYVKNYDNSNILPPKDGGFVYHGHQYLITIKPKGDFAPKSEKEYWAILNELSPWAYCGWSRSKVENGKLVTTFMTDDADIMQEVFAASDKVEVAKVERLTEELCNAHLKANSNWLNSFLPSANMLKVTQTDWYKKLNKGQQNYVAFDEHAFAYVYDPKIYDVGDKRGEFEAKWVKLLEGPEPGHPGSEKLHPYDEAIFGLATIKSDKAAKLLVKIAAERVVKDNAHRHYATKALGLLGDPSVVPDLIPLLYHYNMNTRWDAQIALVRLTGQNFGRDAEAWGTWYNENRKTLGKNLPAFDPTPVDWTCGSNDDELKTWSDPEKQKEVDRQFGE